ncbi:hypothetical protein FJ970_19550 [Mesorhizobium sp. B2-1-8]|uniref:hypothetical protein n=1 Tax=unclassified Mesorhizobium TaxID=325217 RepID=UPI001AED5554|nr:MULTISPECIES: hypothetical protein [unclassified Mesorhizobium]MBZ9669052.1 hypothetical protein [Mesorhizobium sp. ES1-3]UCI17311.1 hypothetical protein FJ970_19550 [Mesorhizobium sp. B2-1-8]
MLGIELVKDRTSKEPAPEATLQVCEETRRHGLVASRSGPYRYVIRMCPPLCLSMADLDTWSTASRAASGRRHPHHPISAFDGSLNLNGPRAPAPNDHPSECHRRAIAPFWETVSEQVACATAAFSEMP